MYLHDLECVILIELNLRLPFFTSSSHRALDTRLQLVFYVPLPFPTMPFCLPAFNAILATLVTVLFQEALQAVSFADFYFGVRRFFLISVSGRMGADILCGARVDIVCEKQPPFFCA